MRRNGESGAQVSFLFFIDIIMAISGVMLFVIMMLILDLAPTDVHIPGGMSMKEAEKQTQALREQIAIEQAKLAELQANAAKDAEKNANAPAPVSAPSKEDEAALKKKLEELCKKSRELAAQIRSLSDKKRNLEQFKKVAFRFGPQDSDRDIALVEISSTGITVQGPGNNVQPHVIQGDIQTCADGMMKDLAAFDTGKVAVLILVKPSAFGFAGGLIDMIRSKNFLTGVEPLEEDRTSIKW